MSASSSWTSSMCELTPHPCESQDHTSATPNQEIEEQFG